MEHTATEAHVLDTIKCRYITEHGKATRSRDGLSRPQQLRLFQQCMSPRVVLANLSATDAHRPTSAKQLTIQKTSGLQRTIQNTLGIQRTIPKTSDEGQSNSPTVKHKRANPKRSVNMSNRPTTSPPIDTHTVKDQQDADEPVPMKSKRKRRRAGKRNTAVNVSSENDTTDANMSRSLKKKPRKRKTCSRSIMDLERDGIIKDPDLVCKLKTDDEPSLKKPKKDKAKKQNRKVNGTCDVEFNKLSVSNMTGENQGAKKAVTKSANSQKRASVRKIKSNVPKEFAIHTVDTAEDIGRATTVDVNCSNMFVRNINEAEAAKVKNKKCRKRENKRATSNLREVNDSVPSQPNVTGEFQSSSLDVDNSHPLIDKTTMQLQEQNEQSTVVKDKGNTIVSVSDTSIKDESKEAEPVEKGQAKTKESSVIKSSRQGTEKKYSQEILEGSTISSTIVKTQNIAPVVNQAKKQLDIENENDVTIADTLMDTKMHDAINGYTVDCKVRASNDGNLKCVHGSSCYIGTNDKDAAVFSSQHSTSNCNMNCNVLTSKADTTADQTKQVRKQSKLDNQFTDVHTKRQQNNKPAKRRTTHSAFGAMHKFLKDHKHLQSKLATTMNKQFKSSKLTGNPCTRAGEIGKCFPTKQLSNRSSSSAADTVSYDSTQTSESRIIQSAKALAFTETTKRMTFNRSDVSKEVQQTRAQVEQIQLTSNEKDISGNIDGQQKKPLTASDVITAGSGGSIQAGDQLLTGDEELPSTSSKPEKIKPDTGMTQQSQLAREQEELITNDKRTADQSRKMTTEPQPDSITDRVDQVQKLQVTVTSETVGQSQATMTKSLTKTSDMHTAVNLPSTSNSLNDTVKCFAAQLHLPIIKHICGNELVGQSMHNANTIAIGPLLQANMTNTPGYNAVRNANIYPVNINKNITMNTYNSPLIIAQGTHRTAQLTDKPPYLAGIQRSALMFDMRMFRCQNILGNTISQLPSIPAISNVSTSQSITGTHPSNEQTTQSDTARSVGDYYDSLRELTVKRVLERMVCAVEAHMDAHTAAMKLKQLEDLSKPAWAENEQTPLNANKSHTREHDIQQLVQSHNQPNSDAKSRNNVDRESVQHEINECVSERNNLKIASEQDIHIPECVPVTNDPETRGDSEMSEPITTASMLHGTSSNVTMDTDTDKCLPEKHNSSDSSGMVKQPMSQVEVSDSSQNGLSMIHDDLQDRFASDDIAPLRVNENQPNEISNHVITTKSDDQTNDVLDPRITIHHPTSPSNSSDPLNNDGNSGDELLIDIVDADKQSKPADSDPLIDVDKQPNEPEPRKTPRKTKRKRGKRPKHKLTMPAKRRIRPVKRDELHRPSILLTIQLPNTSDSKLTTHSDYRIAPTNHPKSQEDFKRSPAKRKRNKIKKERKPYPRRESIFYSSDHPQMKSSLAVTARPTSTIRGEKEQAEPEIATSIATDADLSYANSDGRLSIEFANHNWFLEKYRLQTLPMEPSIDECITSTTVTTKTKKSKCKKSTNTKLKRIMNKKNGKLSTSCESDTSTKQHISEAMNCQPYATVINPLMAFIPQPTDTIGSKDDHFNVDNATCLLSNHLKIADGNQSCQSPIVSEDYCHENTATSTMTDGVDTHGTGNGADSEETKLKIVDVVSLARYVTHDQRNNGTSLDIQQSSQENNIITTHVKNIEESLNMKSPLPDVVPPEGGMLDMTPNDMSSNTTDTGSQCVSTISYEHESQPLDLSVKPGGYTALDLSVKSHTKFKSLTSYHHSAGLSSGYVYQHRNMSEKSLTQGSAIASDLGTDPVGSSVCLPESLIPSPVHTDSKTMFTNKRDKDMQTCANEDLNSELTKTVSYHAAKVPLSDSSDKYTIPTGNMDISDSRYVDRVTRSVTMAAQLETNLDQTSVSSSRACAGNQENKDVSIKHKSVVCKSITDESSESSTMQRINEIIQQCMAAVPVKKTTRVATSRKNGSLKMMSDQPHHVSNADGVSSTVELTTSVAGVVTSLSPLSTTLNTSKINAHVPVILESNTLDQISTTAMDANCPNTRSPIPMKHESVAMSSLSTSPANCETASTESCSSQESLQHLPVVKDVMSHVSQRTYTRQTSTPPYPILTHPRHVPEKRKHTHTRPRQQHAPLNDSHTLDNTSQFSDENLVQVQQQHIHRTPDLPAATGGGETLDKRNQLMDRTLVQDARNANKCPSTIRSPQHSSPYAHLSQRRSKDRHSKASKHTIDVLLSERKKPLDVGQSSPTEQQKDVAGLEVYNHSSLGSIDKPITEISRKPEACNSQLTSTRHTLDGSDVNNPMNTQKRQRPNRHRVDNIQTPQVLKAQQTIMVETPQGPISLPLAQMNCDDCGTRASLLCSGCKRVAYCSKRCQLSSWMKHKQSCVK